MPSSEPHKVRATLYLPHDVLDEARNAAFHLAGPPARLTLTKLAENALRAELQRLKEQFNGGEEFPVRSEELKVVDPSQPNPRPKRRGPETTTESAKMPRGRPETEASMPGEQGSVRARLLDMILQNEATRKPKPN